MERVSPLALALTITIGLLNIAFNISIQQAATTAAHWTSGLLSWRFALSFLIGCMSLGLLFALYSTQIYLGRAILLMGAVSIIGGTIFGTIIKKQQLDGAEAALLAAIAALFVYRAFLK